ncbi:hypothetical protein V1289_006005 [Bradyrhizobium sp. AZCC 2289]
MRCSVPIPTYGSAVQTTVFRTATPTLRRTSSRQTDTPAKNFSAYFGTILKYGSASSITRAIEGRAFRRSK